MQGFQLGRHNILNPGQTPCSLPTPEHVLAKAREGGAEGKLRRATLLKEWLRFAGSGDHVYTVLLSLSPLSACIPYNLDGLGGLIFEET